MRVSHPASYGSEPESAHPFTIGCAAENKCKTALKRREAWSGSRSVSRLARNTSHFYYICVNYISKANELHLEDSGFPGVGGQDPTASAPHLSPAERRLALFSAVTIASASTWRTSTPALNTTCLYIHILVRVSTQILYL